jgi:hypothetical protein
MSVNIAHPKDESSPIPRVRANSVSRLLRVEGVWVRGEVTAEATVGGPNKSDCHNPVGELVGATPEAENEQLRRERLGNVHGFERLVLKGNHAALTDGLTHAHICARLREGSAAGHSAKHCCLATFLAKI